MTLDLENIYTYHAPNDEQAVKYAVIRKDAKELAYTINKLCPESRERSIAFTKLEEAAMWANASIARNE